MIDESLFLLAAERGELGMFIAGRKPYFVMAKNAEKSPQNARLALKLEVYKPWRETHDPNIPVNLVAGMLEALGMRDDLNRSIVSVSEWLWYYYYCVREKLTGNEYYCDLFDLDLGEIPFELKRLAGLRERELRSDLRWFGVKRNSNSGLWGPLIRQLTMIRDVFGGPDMVPNEKYGSELVPRQRKP